MKAASAPKAAQDRTPVAQSNLRSLMSSRTNHNILETPRDLSRVEYLSVMPTVRPRLGFE